jgi:hypothetical protein
MSNLQCLSRLAAVALPSLLAALLTACGGGGGGSGTTSPPPATGLFVDPLGGSDAAKGTRDAPFKTIAKALSVAASGETVRLGTGTYSVSSGETFPLSVPDGVSIEAIVAGNAVLLGTAQDTGLALAGAAAVSNLVLRGFGKAITASAGALALDGVTFADDGVAVQLTGSAAATLSGTEVAGGVDSYGAFSLDGASTLAMTGGSVSGVGCNGFGAVTAGSAALTLEGVTFHDNAGTALYATKASSITFKSGTIAYPSGGACQPRELVALVDSAQLVLQGSALSGGGTGIQGSGTSISVSVTGGSITGAVNAGIDAAVVAVDGTSISDNGYAGIYASREATTSVSLKNATLSNNQYFGLTAGDSANVLVRNTRITTSIAGNISDAVYWYGSNGTVDLGTAADPGGNTFQGNLRAELEWDDSTRSQTSTVVHAVGNTWDPSTDGSDSGGRYAGGVAVGPVNGRNFLIDIQFATVQL